MSDDMPGKIRLETGEWRYLVSGEYVSYQAWVQHCKDVLDANTIAKYGIYDAKKGRWVK